KARKARRACAAFEAVAAQEARVACLLVEIAEARDEQARRLAVFVDRVAPGQDVEVARRADAAEVIDKIMTQDARRIAKAVRVLARFRVQQNARRFERRSGDDK